MNKKKFISILLFIVTLGLLVTTFYINSLLQNNQKNSITQIKKTKASSQTYHKYLAVNFTLPTITVKPTQSSSSKAQQTNPLSPTNIISPTKQSTSLPVQKPTNEPTKTAYKSASSQKQTSISSLSSSTFPTVYSSISNTPTSSQSKTSVFSSSSQGIITYNNPTIVPKFSSSNERNNYSSLNTTNTNTSVMISPSIVKNLPETGYVQYSSILFIVAVITIFIAFLY
jgi:hypothetical protein